MDNIELENEIELRMDPSDFSLSSTQLSDIMNEFDLDEQEVVFAYSQIIEKKREELKDTTKDVVDYFREKGVFYPSFEEFKEIFNEFEPTYINDNILKDMHKKEIKDENQISLFELKKIIKEELGSMWTDFDSEEFEGEAKKAAMQDIGDEFEELGDNRFEKNIDPEDFVDDLNRVKLNLPSDEEEFERVSNMIKKKKSHEDKFGAGTMNEETELGGQPLFKPTDSQGNDINLKSIVSNLDGSKKGRVKGYGDNGEGGLTVKVEWTWPIDMKFTKPEEMGEKTENPNNLMVQNINEENKEDNIEEMRGLGHGVKNSGDRNVKLNKDNSHAPVTTLSETKTLDDKIKTLSENTLKKKDILNFINEEARNFARDIKNESL